MCGDVTLHCVHRNALSLRPQIIRITGSGKGESRKEAADRNSLHFVISSLIQRLGEVVSCCRSKVAIIQGLTLDGRAQVDKVRTECDGAPMQGPQPALKADYMRAFGLGSNPGSPGENGQRSLPAPLKAAYTHMFEPQGNRSSTGSDARSIASAPLKEYYAGVFGQQGNSVSNDNAPSDPPLMTEYAKAIASSNRDRLTDSTPAAVPLKEECARAFGAGTRP